MREASINKMESLIVSIEKIGETTMELQYKGTKIIEKLKKNRAELMQEAFNDAFSPNDN